MFRDETYIWKNVHCELSTYLKKISPRKLGHFEQLVLIFNLRKKFTSTTIPLYWRVTIIIVAKFLKSAKIDCNDTLEKLLRFLGGPGISGGPLRPISLPSCECTQNGMQSRILLSIYSVPRDFSASGHFDLSNISLQASHRAAFSCMQKT